MQSDAKRAISDLWVFPQKPKYQPQLQMIQVVGPNDNDYIYINFKDFEYDTKWEFPRENLELGMNHTRQAQNVQIHITVSRKWRRHYSCNLHFPGKELGSGAFGMVVQATAYGIDKPGVPQQVAVKMLKGKWVLSFLCFLNNNLMWIVANVALSRCRETSVCGKGGSDVRAEDADSHRPSRQHREPARSVHRVRYNLDGLSPSLPESALQCYKYIYILF